MRFAHFDKDERLRAGIVLRDSIYDLEMAARALGLPGFSGVSSVDEALSRGILSQLTGREKEVARVSKGIPLESVRLRSPILFPEKIFCVAENYRAHAREAGGRPPEKPYLFTKFRNAIIGPGDPILIPKISREVDWEAELAVVIGQGGKHITREEAMDHVAGYTISNDVSFRDLQFPAGWPERLNQLGQNWVEGKALDNAFPLGPWLVTSDEIRDPHKLRVSLLVNGSKKQDASTGDMVFKVDALIEFISAGITLRAGDVISTGTPPGVSAFTDKRFLRDGDLVEAGIDEIGVLRNPVKSEV
jgi:2-keto-4-pentenoate hydratase/2-oxohepta-3-ene-1,7-dioic acid hydratase in catechol pathway